MNSRLIGGILLVTGTTIGAGMLALPVVTGFGGFIPSCILFFFYWLYMIFTAFLLLEVNLWMDEKTNLMTMIKNTLGKKGQVVGGIIYLFLLYTLTTAYMAGSGPIFLNIIEKTTGIILPEFLAPFFLLFLFGYFVYQGTQSVDCINRFLIGGLVLTYGLTIFFLIPYLKPNLLMHQEWNLIGGAFSIVSTSFGFHIIIPTLTDYLHRDVKQLRLVLWIGSFIPLMIYIIWEMIILGIVPLQGTNGLINGYRQGLDGATLFSLYLQRPDLVGIVQLFSLFAIVTSFLGVSLSLKDFLADGLNVSSTSKGRFTICSLTFFPPLLLVLINPHSFLNALEYAGAFGVVTLLGLFPVLMVWKGRYEQERAGSFKTLGGKGGLILALIISIGVISLEILTRLGWITLLPVNLSTRT